MHQTPVVPAVSEERSSDSEEPLAAHFDVWTATDARDATNHTDYPTADFLDPVVFGWTEAGFEARQAVKAYSEATHADR